MYNFSCFHKIYLTSIGVDVDFSKNIKKYYQSSLSTEKKTNETTSIINNSKNTRNDFLCILDTLTSKEDLSLEKLKQIKIPNIQILQEKVNVHDSIVKVSVVFTWYVCAWSLSRVWLLGTPWTVARLLCPWNFPGKNTRVGCHFLLQGICPTQAANLHLLQWQIESLPPWHLGSLWLFLVSPKWKAGTKIRDQLSC